MNTLVLWVAPVVIGGVIGYVTNDIAIKMLFRPLKELRVFGIRVPFTPGVLPRQRRKLAANIGKMVSRELLTDAIVRDRLRSAEFRTLLSATISGYTGKFLETPVSRLAGGGEGSEGAELSRAIGALARRFLNSDAFASLVRGMVDRLFAHLEDHSAQDLFNLFNREGSSSLEEVLLRALRANLDSGTLERLADAVERTTREYAASGATVGDLLSRAQSISVEPLADYLYPIVVESTLRFLNRPATRTELEVRGKLFLKDAIGELNTLQRFFISAAQYDRTLNERMPAIVDDFIRQIEEFSAEPSNRELIVGSVVKAAESMKQLTLEEAAQKFNLDAPTVARAVATRLLEGLSRLLEDSALVAPALGRLVSQPVSQVLRERLGMDPQATSERIAESLVSNLRGAGPDLGSSFVSRFLAEHGDRGVGSLLSIDEDEKARIDAYLVERTLTMMDERISSILAGLDVQKIVSDRIDSLDMLDVERIVLDVLADQLKWINVFGAILGAILGIVQAVLSSITL